jgi:hypothetical protein
VGILGSFSASVAARALAVRRAAGPQLPGIERLPDSSVTTVHPSVTLRRVIAGVKAGNGTGFCAKCGNEQGGCAPCGRCIKCMTCGCNSVFGADEAFMVALFNDADKELRVTPPGP